jgi:hypothetical protein
VADLSSIASIATAGGTLVLAVATFSATRSTGRHWNLDRAEPRSRAA